MRRICIIPARGGSKRIPKKNIKLFLGKPIIAYSIEAALNSGLYDKVIVSTDDEEIKKIAESYNAEVPFLRSEKNSNDFATTVDVLLEVLEKLIELNLRYDVATCIYPTAPFTTPKLLKDSISILENKKCDCVFPIVKYSYPIQRALQLNHEAKIEMINQKNTFTRSQDLQDSYHDAGQFYSFYCKTAIDKQNLMTDNTYGIEVDELKVQDIDNETDWKLAELKYEL